MCERWCQSEDVNVPFSLSAVLTNNVFVSSFYVGLFHLCLFSYRRKLLNVQKRKGSSLLFHPLSV